VSTELRDRREATARETFTEWHDAVDRLNVDTCEAAELAFAHGETAGVREFVWAPIRAFAAEAFSGAPRERWSRAVVASYWWIARAAKLWEVEMHWRDLHIERFETGSVSAVMRREWRETLRPLVVGGEDGMPLGGGRGATSRFDTEQGGVVIRRFRRGGAMRWLGDLYFGVRPRPLREFAVLLRARRRGLPVPDPLAAVVERTALVAYRGRLFMREIVGGAPILRWLDDAADGGAAILPRLAHALRELHDAGLDHPDLNLENVLVVSRPYGPRIVFVDLDRARLGTSSLGAAARRRALRRLRRSAAKLDPAGRLLPASALDRIEALYWDPQREARGEEARLGDARH
jgi:3-deoxy-D-manno-octulosonic acid kinase